MKFIKSGQAPRDPATGDLYVMGDIGAALLAGAPDTGQLDIYMVDFAAGARNRVHIHKNDQVLIGASGRGIVADAIGEHVMEPGDVAVIPAGHPHWHGATTGSAFSHIAISTPGDEITIVDGDDRGAWGALPEGSDT
jgi:quercetin dioxygenase-like cupin family protein